MRRILLLLLNLVGARAFLSPPRPFSYSRPGTVSAPFLSAETKSSSSDEQVSPAVEELIQALQHEVERLQQEQTLSTRSTNSDSDAPVPSFVEKEATVEELQAKLTSYQQFMAQYIVKAQQDKIRAIQAAEQATALKFQHDLEQHFMEKTPHHDDKSTGILESIAQAGAQFLGGTFHLTKRQTPSRINVTTTSTVDVARDLNATTKTKGIVSAENKTFPHSSSRSATEKSLVSRKPVAKANVDKSEKRSTRAVKDPSEGKALNVSKTLESTPMSARLTNGTTTVPDEKRTSVDIENLEDEIKAAIQAAKEAVDNNTSNKTAFAYRNGVEKKSNAVSNSTMATQLSSTVNDTIKTDNAIQSTEAATVGKNNSVTEVSKSLRDTAAVTAKPDGKGRSSDAASARKSDSVRAPSKESPSVRSTAQTDMKGRPTVAKKSDSVKDLPKKTTVTPDGRSASKSDNTIRSSTKASSVKQSDSEADSSKVPSSPSRLTDAKKRGSIAALSKEDPVASAASADPKTDGASQSGDAVPTKKSDSMATTSSKGTTVAFTARSVSKADSASLSSDASLLKKAEIIGRARNGTPVKKSDSSASPKAVLVTPAESEEATAESVPSKGKDEATKNTSSDELKAVSKGKSEIESADTAIPEASTPLSADALNDEKISNAKESQQSQVKEKEISKANGVRIPSSRSSVSMETVSAGSSKSTSAHSKETSSSIDKRSAQAGAKATPGSGTPLSKDESDLTGSTSGTSIAEDRASKSGANDTASAVKQGKSDLGNVNKISQDLSQDGKTMAEASDAVAPTSSVAAAEDSSTSVAPSVDTETRSFPQDSLQDPSADVSASSASTEANSNNDIRDEDISSGRPEIDPSLFTKPVLIRMPQMGKGTAKVIRWYKKKGDHVEFNDMLCDIETEDFTFGIVKEDKVSAIMGDISASANEPISDNDLLCTVYHPHADANVGKPKQKVQTDDGGAPNPSFSDRMNDGPMSSSAPPAVLDQISPPASAPSPAASVDTRSPWMVPFTGKTQNVDLSFALSDSHESADGWLETKPDENVGTVDSSDADSMSSSTPSGNLGYVSPPASTPSPATPSDPRSPFMVPFSKTNDPEMSLTSGGAPAPDGWWENETVENGGVADNAYTSGMETPMSPAGLDQMSVPAPSPSYSIPSDPRSPGMVPFQKTVNPDMSFTSGGGAAPDGWWEAEDGGIASNAQTESMSSSGNHGDMWSPPASTPSPATPSDPRSPFMVPFSKTNNPEMSLTSGGAPAPDGWWKTETIEDGGVSGNANTDDMQKPAPPANFGRMSPSRPAAPVDPRSSSGGRSNAGAFTRGFPRARSSAPSSGSHAEKSQVAGAWSKRVPLPSRKEQSQQKVGNDTRERTTPSSLRPLGKVSKTTSGDASSILSASSISSVASTWNSLWQKGNTSRDADTESPTHASSVPSTQQDVPPSPARSSANQSDVKPSGEPRKAAGNEYLSALGGNQAKQGPPKERRATASMGTNYLDNMSAGTATPVDWSNARGPELPDLASISTPETRPTTAAPVWSSASASTDAAYALTEDDYPSALDDESTWMPPPETAKTEPMSYSDNMSPSDTQDWSSIESTQEQVSQGPSPLPETVSSSQDSASRRMSWSDLSKSEPNVSDDYLNAIRDTPAWSGYVDSISTGSSSPDWSIGGGTDTPSSDVAGRQMIANEQTTIAPSKPVFDVDPTKYTEPAPIRMPEIGDEKAKVVRWYKSKGDLVQYEDMLCDIETDEFTFAMVNEEREAAIMGEIAVPENAGFVISEGDLLCTVLRPKTWGP